jgi:uncharacterized protein YndB with AHSA1/START domain
MQDTQAQATSVRAEVVVSAPVQRAFRVFTEEMASWWHPEHHILQGELAKMVIEPRVGGRVYDLGADGTECTWARVLAFEPPHRLVLRWDISPRWEIETDLEKTSEVVVTFVAEDDRTTRVELEHRHLDRHGEGWEGERDAVGSPGGWPGGLRRFAEYVER